MKINTDGIGHRLLYGVLAAIAIWYIHLIPITLMGYWRNLLIPSSTMLINFVHVYTIIVVWAIVHTKRSVVITTAVVTTLLFAIQILIGGLPTVEMIKQFGMANYIENWVMILLPVVFAPIAIAVLLIKADSLAPKIIRQWRGA